MKKIRLIAMLIAALVFMIMMISPIQGKKSKVPEEELTEVVVANINIDNQTKISNDMIEIRKIHEELVPQNAIKTIDEVVGKATMINMFVGDVFTPNKIKDIGSSEAGLAFIIPKGMRAITMYVEQDTGVAGLIKVGNHVDIISVLGDEIEDDEKYKRDNKGNANDRAILLLQNKEVLAIDRAINNISDESDGSEDESSIYATITLAVTPEEALELSLSQEIGKGNRAVLRHQEDLELMVIPDVLPEDIINKGTVGGQDGS